MMGGGNFEDVNISAILSSFQIGYDKKVRPNYGGKAAAAPTLIFYTRLDYDQVDTQHGCRKAR